MCSLRRTYKTVFLILLGLAGFIAGILISMTTGGGKGVRVRVRCMSLWMRCACVILGIRIRKEELWDIPRGSFIVADHCSYLDILILGSLTPAVFVAKKEVASWPFIGSLVRSAGTVFVDRASRLSMPLTIREIENRLSSGVSVIVFPEGTTGNGAEVLEFKSSFFTVPVDKNCVLLPVSIVYLHVNGEILDAQSRDAVAWYGGMSFFPHLWNVLGMRRIEVTVRGNPAVRDIITLDASLARKQLAAYARRSVKAGFDALSTSSTP
ncbi:MAG: lysophospholipid acyltransferase family protein [Nitrospiraceae bacterium]|nr:lysophospholipid acyltransferase family protein [Nitrospiraceae bacterium]